MLIILGILSITSYADTNKIEEHYYIDGQYYINQDIALGAYFSLMDSFGYDENTGSGCIYPDVYAGSYINDENRLTVLLTEINESLASEYYERCNTKEISIQLADHSLNEIQSEFISLIDDMSEYGFSKINLSEMHNCIRATVSTESINVSEAVQNSREAQTELESKVCVKYQCVSIEYETDVSNKDLCANDYNIANEVDINSVNGATTLRGGNLIYNTFSEKNATVSYWAYKNSTYGVVTVGHFAIDEYGDKSTATVEDTVGNTFGTVLESDVYYNSTADASFTTRTNTGFTAYNYLKNGVSIYGTRTPAQNATVYLCANSGAYSATYDGTTVYRSNDGSYMLCEQLVGSSTFAAVNTDSGSPFWFYYNSKGQIFAIYLGMQSGFVNALKASTVNNTLGVSTYIAG